MKVILPYFMYYDKIYIRYYSSIFYLLITYCFRFDMPYTPRQDDALRTISRPGYERIPAINFNNRYDKLDTNLNGKYVTVNHGGTHNTFKRYNMLV